MRYEWLIKINNNKPSTIVLLHSKKSKKRRLFIDGVKKVEKTMITV